MPRARDERGLADLLETAAERVSLRERWLRLQNTAPRIVVVAVAATLAYAISLHLLDHPRPFFAPIAVVVVSGVTFGATSRRAIQLALGVAIGILVADLAVELIGTGTWQIAVIVFFGMGAVVLLGGDQLAV
ncbi:MAG: FUSC family protein, partial [Solirubrobacteraceae bacterium]|nr:FUSC family protein [Solirubrobacteraceae bacterium]